MSLVTLITGTESGSFQLGNYGQIYALTDSDILINGPIGEARFTLPKGLTFGATAMAGSTPFPNDINQITVFGQGQVLAVETTATGGGGGAGFTSVSQSASFPYTVSFLSGSTVIASYSPVGAATASFAFTSSIATSASFAFTSSIATSASYALTSSYAETASFAPTASYAISASYISGAVILTTNDGVQITGSLIVSGSNTFINIGPAILSGSVQISESLSVDGPIYGTASFSVSSSFALTASYISGGITPSIDTSSLFVNELIVGPTEISGSGSWRLISSASSLAFQFYSGSDWVTDTYLDGTPISGSIMPSASYAVSASYAETASYVNGALVTSSLKEGPGITINAVGGDLVISSSTAALDTSSFATTASVDAIIAWTGSAYTGSVAGFATTSSVDTIIAWTGSAFTGSTLGFATTASFNELSASYLASSASFSASIADLYTGSGGGGGTTGYALLYGNSTRVLGKVDWAIEYNDYVSSNVNFTTGYEPVLNNGLYEITWIMPLVVTENSRFILELFVDGVRYKNNERFSTANAHNASGGGGSLQFTPHIKMAIIDARTSPKSFYITSNVTDSQGAILKIVKIA